MTELERLLERLNEALKRVHHNEAWPMGLNTRVALGEVCEAARTYADLLANRVEPDYEAALASWEESRDTLLSDAEAIHFAVDAAIGDRLLINPPTEEEEV